MAYSIGMTGFSSIERAFCMAPLSQSMFDPVVISTFAEQFDASPLRCVQIENFLREDIAESVSHFLQSEAKFAPAYGLKSVAGHAAEEDAWAAAPDSDRMFFNEMLVSSDDNFSLNMLSFLKLRQYLNGQEFCQFASSISGLDLSSSLVPRVHLLREGHYLHAHHDRAKNRRVAYILYLTPDWKEQFGGKLAIAAEDGAITKITPSYNSLLLFDVYTQKEHYIEPVLPTAEGRPRLTMSAWLNDG